MQSAYFTNYLYYASENMASPRLHEWACLFTLSTALSRKVWFQNGDWRIHPNLYVFFCGEPGDRKSTAMRLAQKLVHDFTDIELGPDQITREALTQYLQKKCARQYVEDGKLIDYSPITLFADELIIFLGAEPERMIQILTGLWDCGTAFRVHTKNMGNDEIVRPCLNLLGCLTPSIVNNMIQQSIISGGFARRMIFVYTSGRGPRKAIVKMLPAHYAAKAWCVEYAKKAQGLVGPFSMTPDGQDFYTSWFNTDLAEQEEAATTTLLKSWYSSKGDQLFKVAMNLSVAESLDKVIKLHHLQKALSLLDSTETDMMSVLGGAGRNELAPVIRAIELLVKKFPEGISLKAIKAATVSMAKPDELATCLQFLVDTDAIALQPKPFSNGTTVMMYYPPKV